MKKRAKQAERLRTFWRNMLPVRMTAVSTGRSQPETSSSVLLSLRSAHIIHLQNWLPHLGVRPPSG
jgi:hypothetical protein